MWTTQRPGRPRGRRWVILFWRPPSARLVLPRPHHLVAPLYVNNRRDGSRLLSTALLIFSVGLIRFDHPLGPVICLVSGSLSLYWGFCYGRLDH